MNISRYESGIREPSLKILICYEVIFGVLLKQLFRGLYQNVEKEILTRAQEMLSNSSVDSGAQKIEALKSLTEKLALRAETNYGDRK